ncbi:MAG: urease accessory UreF family protein [Candidatus Rokuibacteriota bacterium]
MTTEPALAALLQFGDGLFPAGGFAHSFGLETYAQQGRLRHAGDLDALIAAHLDGAAGPADAVAVALAVRRAGAADVAGLVALDDHLDAMKCVPEFRAASVQMGRQTLRVAAALGEDRVLAALSRAVADGLTPGHHAVAFGAALGGAGATAAAAATVYLHSTAALLVGAALRLIALGQVDGQRVLAAQRPRIARLAAAAAAAGGADDMWSFTPGLEVAGIGHATLEMRLFRS